MKIQFSFLFMLIVCCAFSSSNPADVLFLCVGNKNYWKIDPKSERETDDLMYDDVPGAEDSARLVAESLQKSGARFGLLLLSKTDKLISSDDIKQAFYKLRDESKKYKNPLLIFYYCGHGLQDPVSEVPLLALGNFRGVQANLENPVSLADRIIHVTEITEWLEKKKLPYMMLIDSCRADESKTTKSLAILRTAQVVTNSAPDMLRNLAENPSLPKFVRDKIESKETQEELEEFLKDEEKVNEMKHQLLSKIQSEMEQNDLFKFQYFAAFSAAKGEEVYTVDNPVPGLNGVGPICRRLWKIYDFYLTGKAEKMTLSQVMFHFNNNNLDPDYSNPFVIRGTEEFDPLLYSKQASLVKIEEQYGTVNPSSVTAPDPHIETINLNNKAWKH